MCLASDTTVDVRIPNTRHAAHMTGTTCRMYHFSTNVMLMEHSGETRSMLNVDAAVADSVTSTTRGHENANDLNMERV